MQKSLDDQQEDFIRECGGGMAIGHVTDVLVEKGRLLVLVSRPTSWMDILKVLTGRYHPRVLVAMEAEASKDE